MFVFWNCRLFESYVDVRNKTNIGRFHFKRFREIALKYTANNNAHAEKIIPKIGILTIRCATRNLKLTAGVSDFSLDYITRFLRVEIVVKTMEIERIYNKTSQDDLPSRKQHSRRMHESKFRTRGLETNDVCK